MKRGIGLMNEPTRESIIEALVCFDAALEMRRQLPLADAPMLRFGLAASLLNRADALVRLRDAAQLASALQSYDEGIAVLGTLALDDDIRFPRRLAMAFQNRGLALLAQWPAAFDDAIASFRSAIDVLEHDRCASLPDRQYLLAVAWTNLANAHVSQATDDSWSPARESARQAIALMAATEADDVNAAEAGLNARHVLCRAMARRQTLTMRVDAAIDEDVHDATDLVDEGLALARLWEQKGVSRFRPIAYDLFRFGARVYALHQPQFLNEFVRENMDPTRSSQAYVDSHEMRDAAQEVLSFLSAR
jgi:hypothetical protein